MISSRDHSKPPGSDPGHPVVLTLEVPASAAFRVIDLDGGRAVGARVIFTWLDQIWTYPPAELAERLTARTGPGGRANLHDISFDLIREVQVTTDSAGIQTFYSTQGFKREDELALKPVLPLEGRVVADDPAAVRGLMVHLRTNHPDVRRPVMGQGESDVVTDDQGRFHVPVLAKGLIFAWALVPEGSLYRQAKMPSRELTEDRIKLPVGGVPGLARVTVRLPTPGLETFKLEIPLKRMVQVRGVVRNKGTGTPIPNVGIIFGSRELEALLPLAVTDGEGRYEAIAPPGRARGSTSAIQKSTSHRCKAFSVHPTLTRYRLERLTAKCFGPSSSSAASRPAGLW